MMPFVPDDIEPAGYVPGTTALAYTVSRNGEEIGRVHALRAIGMINSGEEPRDWIARRLSEVEEHEGFDNLASALRATLDM
jgi:hypothetical protein